MLIIFSILFPDDAVWNPAFRLPLNLPGLNESKTSISRSDCTSDFSSYETRSSGTSEEDLIFEMTGIDSALPVLDGSQQITSSLSPSDSLSDSIAIAPCSLSLPEVSKPSACSLILDISVSSVQSHGSPTSDDHHQSPKFLSLLQPGELPGLPLHQLDSISDPKFPLMSTPVSPSLLDCLSGSFQSHDDDSYAAGDCSSLIFHMSGLTSPRTPMKPWAASTPVKRPHQRKPANSSQDFCIFEMEGLQWKWLSWTLVLINHYIWCKSVDHSLLTLLDHIQVLL